MLGAFARTISRHWPWVIAAWAALVVAVFLAAPPWESVVTEGEFRFLPADVSSLQAERQIAAAFPEEAAKSSLVLLLEREAGLQDRDFKFITEVLVPELRRLTQGDRSDGQEAGLVKRIRSHGGRAEALLNSDDGQASLVVLELDTEFLHERVERFVERVKGRVAQLRSERRVPSGLQISFTGSAAVGAEYLQAKRESAHQIEQWTRWLVIGLLLFVFRAPLAALIPLVTLYCGIQVALKCLALMAQAGYIGLFSGIEVYTTVLVYGAGVNYGMFLVARFQEELAQGRGAEDAIAVAIERVGTAVSASAGTGMFGIGMLALAQFGKFHQAGITIAFGLFMMLCASLTLTPALLRLGGRWVFWPHSPQRPQDASRHSWAKFLDRNWERIGTVIVRHPLWVTLATIAILLPVAVYGIVQRDELSYGIITELPRGNPAVQATNQLQQHYPIGMTGTVSVLLSNEKVDFSRRGTIRAVETLSEKLTSRSQQLDIADIRSVAKPLGRSEGILQPPSESGGYASVIERRIALQRAIEHYVSESKQNHATLLEIVLSTDPLSREAIAQVDDLRAAIRSGLPEDLSGSQIFVDGITANLRDLKQVAEDDRLLLMPVITLTVLAVLMLLLRRILLPIYLVLTVLLSFYVAFGTTFLIFVPPGAENAQGLQWTVSLFLFAVLMAVGADYNVLLISRVDEERSHTGIRRGTVAALRNTATIISSCGIVMAGTFSSLLVGGTLASMVQLGFALAFGIFIDTFVVRPLLIPSFLVMWYGRKGHEREPVVEHRMQKPI